ncbi:YkoP family protein [Brevibacillus sp. TJ4]|uniref:YkoP family protein n=1 Tax=Brevibacillus sp. TJ4 TaxID=3234853 RepID=UPI0037D67A10
MNASLLTLWRYWDWLYQHCTRLQYVEKGNNIFRIVLLRYRGETLVTTDQRTIQNGDLILKIHIHNYYFATLCKGITNELRIALLLRRHIMLSLPKLAAFLEKLENKEHIKGIVGTTMLYKAVEPIGFTVSDVPMNWFFRYKRWYLRLMLRIIHPDGKRKARSMDLEQPLKRVFMSKEALLERYGSKQYRPTGDGL